MYLLAYYTDIRHQFCGTYESVGIDLGETRINNLWMGSWPIVR